MKSKVLIVRHLVLWLSLLVSAPSWSQTQTLTVGVAECPPFVIFENGSYTGLGVYLWEQVGKELGLQWEYEEYPLGSLLEVIRNEDRSLMPDLGISCTSVTSEREQWIDFSHSFNETYTAIATRQNTLWSAIKRFFSDPRVLHALLIVLGVAAV